MLKIETNEYGLLDILRLVIVHAFMIIPIIILKLLSVTLTSFPHSSLVIPTSTFSCTLDYIMFLQQLLFILEMNSQYFIEMAKRELQITLFLLGTSHLPSHPS